MKGLWRKTEPYRYILPSFLFVLAFSSYPLCYGVFLGFNELEPLKSLQPKFNSVDNFKIVFNDPRFYTILLDTTFFVLGSVVASFLLGLATALLLNEKVKGRSVFRSIMLIPWVTPVVVTGIIWRFLLDPNIGVVNFELSRLGAIKDYVAWLIKPLAWYTIVGINCWRLFPFCYLALLAGLSSIREDLYEAAKMDGAGTLDRFRYVTLPGIRGTASVVFILNLIWQWDNFSLIWNLTYGGPGYDTTVLPIYIYMMAFQFYHFGPAAAMGIIAFLIILSLTIFYMKRISVD